MAKPLAEDGNESRGRVLPSHHHLPTKKMNPFWANYRRAWMIGVNAIIDWQKLMLAQAKWLISQNRAWTAPSEEAGGTRSVARPAAAAAQAADEQRRESLPRGSAKEDQRRRSRAAGRKRS